MKKVVKKAAPKKATPKKKVAPVKGAWVPPWAKKAVEEKKTGEIPMKRKGGKTSCSSCSCNGKGCMKCGGKKYGDGGKTTVKGLTKGIEYDKQGKVIMKYDVASKKGDRNVYQAYPDGQLVKSTYNPTKQNARRAMLDTTGYSKGKQSFPKTIELENTKNNRRNGKVTTIKTKVPRKLVKTQIKSMQTMKS